MATNYKIGNGSVIIVNSTSKDDILVWVMQHLHTANKSHSSIPHTVIAEVLKNE